MLSIALASYNGSKYIRKQLDSILFQTISDWELIVCDDCSTDITLQILEEYSQKDHRIKVYENERQLGFVGNFEKAISLCSGDYIALSDQDDVWKDNHLEILLNNIKGCSVVVGNATIIDGKGVLQNYLLSDGERYVHDGNNVDKLYTILCYRNPFFGSASLYLAEELKNVCIPIPKCVKYHDLWFSAVACCKSGINYLYEPVVAHRIHGNNESGTHHIVFWSQVLSSLKNDRKEFLKLRMEICDALLSRISDMSVDFKDAITQIRGYHQNRLEGNRLKTILFMIRHYKQIFSTHSYKQLLARCIGVLVTG